MQCRPPCLHRSSWRQSPGMVWWVRRHNPLTESIVTTSVRRPDVVLRNLLSSAPLGREYAFALAERFYASNQVLTPQNPFWPPTKVPSILYEHGSAKGATVVRYKRSPFDGTWWTIVALWVRLLPFSARKSPPFSTEQYMSRNTPQTLDDVFIVFPCYKLCVQSCM